MENATKALIMVAGVLIALMIIGALLLMFNNLSNYQNTGQQNVREAQVVDFNNQFETYNRKNVRGSDLYSLIGRVIDYNRRKSTEGIGVNSEGNSDEGQYLAYEPMKLEFTITPSALIADTNVTNQLITSNKYEISYTDDNKFRTIMTNISQLESYYGKDIIQKLCTNKNKIFVDASSSNTDEFVNAIKTFNSIVPEEFDVTLMDNMNRIQASKCFTNVAKHKANVYIYYEYVQFKRARFKCTGTEYNEKTGRIISMKFEFTGKFE